MNILIINHYAGSPEMGMEFRPYYFAKEWTAMGHRVDIIAADFSHLRRVNPDVSRDFQEEIIDGIHYHWIKTRRYEGNGGQRAITMAQFIGKLWLHTGRIIKDMDPDVVIDSSTYPLDTYIGQRIRKKSKKKVKVIHEVHDMWPISPVEIGGMSSKHPFIRVMQRGEDSLKIQTELFHYCRMQMNIYRNMGCPLKSFLMLLTVLCWRNGSIPDLCRKNTFVFLENVNRKTDLSYVFLVAIQNLTHWTI